MFKWLLGAVVLMATCCGGGMYFALQSLQAGTEVLKSSGKWVDEQLPPIVKTWDAEKFAALAADEFLFNTPKDQIRKKFDVLRQNFGGLVKMEPAKYLGVLPRTPDFDFVGVHVTADAQFEKKKAKIDLKLKYSKRKFQFANIQVDEVK
ncbi:MAG: hypothetical protein JNM04_06700 [Chthonomonas sp.]|nr:hypothetical protein [Chthonomonas sp.]